LYLTDDGRQHWQPALAVNASGEVMALSVSREALAPGLDLGPASTAARPTLISHTLAPGDDPVESLLTGLGADLALDPALALSQLHAAPGNNVMVSATVRNVGHGSASGCVVRLYAGTYPTGTLLSTVDAPGDLEFNGIHTVSFQVEASGGEQPLYAEVACESDDLGADNNVATGDLGQLPPPTFLRVANSTRYANAFELSWLPPLVEGVEGYRILRGEDPGGPYELVGEAMGTVFHDLLLELGKPYYYVVQAYDKHGVRSPYSTEAGGMLPYTDLYLPLVVRD
jgi:hypothetical protein